MYTTEYRVKSNVLAFSKQLNPESNQADHHRTTSRLFGKNVKIAIKIEPQASIKKMMYILNY